MYCCGMGYDHVWTWCDWVGFKSWVVLLELGGMHLICVEVGL